MMERLAEVAHQMVVPGKGILAADESTGSIQKRFESIKLASTEESRRDYREMLFSSKEALSNYISGVILFDETIRQKAKNGKPLVELIAASGVLPGIKVDKGTKPLPFCPGETVTEGLDGLADRVKEYVSLGAKFAKWRAVIEPGDKHPSYTAILANAHALARYAAICQVGGLVPIVEPEVLMDGNHDIDTCMAVTEWTLKETYQQLYYNKVVLEASILKPNMVVPGKKSPKQVSPQEVAEKTVTVRTRPEPEPYAGGRTFHVYPHGFKGTKTQPAFEGLLCAYYLTCSGTDWATASRPRVQPGDTILVHAGLYKYDRFIYTNDLSISTVPFDGTYYLTASGTPEKPIAIKAAGDGEAIFDGNGAFNLFNVKAGNYTYFEGLTIRNTEIAIWAGTQFIEGSKGLTVKRCRFEDIGMGVYTNYSGSNNFYIADNYFIGRNDPKHLIAWSGNFWAQFAGVEGQVFPPKMASYIAVKVYGSGHVIAYNYVANFHDGIDVETYGNPDGSAAIDGPKYPSKEYRDRRPVSIDYYNNYMTNFHDDAFEIDGSMHNV